MLLKLQKVFLFSFWSHLSRMHKKTVNFQPKQLFLAFFENRNTLEDQPLLNVYKLNLKKLEQSNTINKKNCSRFSRSILFFRNLGLKHIQKYQFSETVHYDEFPKCNSNIEWTLLFSTFHFRLIIRNYNVIIFFFRSSDSG